MALFNTASKPVAAVADAARRFDPLRPVRYAKGFIGGTFDSTFNGMANWGRKGMWIGTGLGVLVALAAAGPVGMAAWAVILCGTAGGLAAGSVAGGAVGLVTGGIRGMARENRRDKYSEDLLARSRAASRPSNGVDYRDAHRAYKTGENYNQDRLFQQERENEQYSTHFRDMVSNSRGNHERGV